MSKIKVLVAYGDESSPEVEVSKMTGEGAIAGFRRMEDQYEVIPLWAERISPEYAAKCVAMFNNGEADVIFNAFLGAAGEDGRFPKMLEELQKSVNPKRKIVYTHSGRKTASAAMDKVRFKSLIAGRIANLRSQPGQHNAFKRLVLPDTLDFDQAKERVDACSQLHGRNWDGLICKPAANGSSIGIMRVRNLFDFKKAQEMAAASPNETFIFEPYIEGIEVTCGVLGTSSNAKVLPPTAIIKPDSETMFDYEAKYRPSPIEYITPATGAGLSEAICNEIARIAYYVHTTFEFRGVSRTDMIVKGDNIIFLETNTNPGMTPKSFIPKQAKVLGIDYDAMLRMIVDDAMVYWSNQ